ncbi:MAG: threonylcarbamoyl-AMP synthase [Rhodospirillales bacterium]|nr:threonylcarbamoyl-AMP synthase [Rhodospirillales bacterium]
MIKTANAKTIQEAAAILRDGGLVAMPTETVYGLAADATNGEAVAGIFEAKGRPAFNPLIAHIESAEAAAQIVEMDDRAYAAAQAFWPGPLTLVLPRRADCKVSELCGAGLPTQAVRVPAHKTALALIKAAGVPLAAPSANKSGSVSPTTPLLVAESLGDSVDMILAAGPCDVGLESTVLDLSGEQPVVLRPGAITAEQIAEVLDCEVTVDLGDHDKPKSPGQLLRHYAPSIPVRLNAVDLEPGEALLAFGSIKFMGIKGGGAAKDLPEHQFRNLSEAGDLHEAAANLFRMLNELDSPNNKGIAVMAIPDNGLGLAINDRLRRAAAGSRR